MLVNEVFDVFKEYPDDPDDHNVWVGLISAENRAGYLCIDGEKHPDYENTLLNDDMKEFAKELLERDAPLIEKFNHRPRIEDASFAMQKTLEAAKEKGSMMLFVEEEALLDSPLWTEIGLSKQEYEQQMDADIEKFGLSCVVKNEDECLYVCYQDFLCSFTENGREKVMEAEQEREGIVEAAAKSSRPIKALIATDETALEKIKEQFGIEVQYTDKNAILVDPFYHSNIQEEIDYYASSWYDDSKYGEAVLNDDKIRKELFDEICFRLDRAANADSDGISWGTARDIIEQCFRHEKNRYDHPENKATAR